MTTRKTGICDIVYYSAVGFGKLGADMPPANDGSIGGGQNITRTFGFVNERS